MQCMRALPCLTAINSVCVLSLTIIVGLWYDLILRRVLHVRKLGPPQIFELQAGEV